MSILIVDPRTEKLRRTVTPEEMSHRPDDGRVYEVVNGQLVEKATSDIAHLVVANLWDALAVWSHALKQGRSFSRATFRFVSADTDMVRRLDVAYLSSERLAAYSWGHAHLEVVPDLAVEVISPKNKVVALEQKIEDYLRAGVRRVWVLIPEVKKVRIHRAPGDVSELVADAVLTDEVVLPGFQCPLSTLFAIPEALPKGEKQPQT
jgi:Uma2 family endonuclease